MATVILQDQLYEDIMHGVHDFETDQLTIALTTNAEAPVAGDAVLGDLTTISLVNLSSPNITTSSSGQTSGVYSLVLADLVLTASGSVGPFRHVVWYNNTPTSPADPLIARADHGSDVTLATSETYTVDHDAGGLFTAQAA